MNVENAILGTIMKHNYLFGDVGLKTENFTDPLNQYVFDTMKTLYAEQRPLDAISILTKANAERLGGAPRIMAMGNLSNEQKFDDYVLMLLEIYRENQKRNILHVAQEEDWDIEKISVELGNLEINKTNDRNHIRDLTVEVFEKPWDPEELPSGIITGLHHLQQATSGWQKAELIILAARPSMGKTDMMLHLAKQAGWSGAIPIVFSLEMNAKSLRDRLIASTGNYNRSKMRNLTQLTDGQKDTWSTTLARVSETNMEIFDNSGQTLGEMRTKIRKVAALNPSRPLIIFVDYLTLIKPMGDYRGNNHLAISEISKGLKAIAKEFDCPVISLAQLSRGVEQRSDKRPMLSDLRESGSIEEDADVVLFLYRDSYYSKNDEDKTMEVIIAKNRNGGTGTVKAMYSKFTGVISDDRS